MTVDEQTRPSEGGPRNATCWSCSTTWESGIGLDWVLACYAALCVMAIAFTYRFLPETSGLSVEEITERYEEIQSHGTFASVNAASP